jgi:hypothetical protein
MDISSFLLLGTNAFDSALGSIIVEIGVTATGPTGICTPVCYLLCLNEVCSLFDALIPGGRILSFGSPSLTFGDVRKFKRFSLRSVEYVWQSGPSSGSSGRERYSKQEGNSIYC